MERETQNARRNWSDRPRTTKACTMLPRGWAGYEVHLPLLVCGRVATQLHRCKQ